MVPVYVLTYQDKTVHFYLYWSFFWILKSTFRDVYDAFETPSARVP